tara:strand:+ start:244 stop:588 length:345 start_codon:yes stop_codon:yes gene_type:complete
MSSEIIFATQIRLHRDKKNLSVHFNDGFETQISAELLRVESPSAEVQGHGPYQKKVIRGKKNVKILNIEYVGNYAIRLLFDDGHETGIYSWVLLHDYGVRQETLYSEYLKRLEL